MHPKIPPVLVLIAVGAYYLAMQACLKGNPPNHRGRGEGEHTPIPPNDSNASSDQIPGLNQDTPEKMASLSLHNTVRFKKQQLLKSDLESSLGLSSEEMCKELATSTCVDDVHHLALGGVDAYKRGVFSGITESMVTSPIALERIAIAACSERARRDLKSGEELIFSRMSLDAAGNFSSADLDDHLKGSVVSLYRRVLGRLPNEQETAAFIEMYAAVGQRVVSDRAFEWARLSCYVVVTSLEFVFY